MSQPLRQADSLRLRARRLHVEPLEARQLLATLDPAQAFAMHSRPGAAKVIYLDFDGHKTVGTSWNDQFGEPTITTPPYTIDSDPAISTDERLNIIKIFEGVAEDFRPFDVDVTTQEPPLEDLENTGAGDVRWGVRVAIGGTETEVLGSGNAGGRAYVGSFDWDSDTPVFVFSDVMNHGNVQNTTVAISHEVGHSLGLSHDGQNGNEYYSGQGAGASSWGPLMGTPYGRRLSQWSKGEYPGATNTEDDLAIITTQNGFGYRPDDVGNTLFTAAPLAVNAHHVSAAGVIERNTDVDLFKFTTVGGTADLTIANNEFDPNLDLFVQLLDSSGRVIAGSDPAGDVDARITKSLDAGTYYLRIDGNGFGSPLQGTGYTGYGSLGAYTIRGTIDQSAATLALGSPVGYTLNAASWVQVAPSATLTAAAGQSFAGGNLTIRVSAGVEPGNRLTLVGGAFQVSGANLLYSGKVIGAVDGGGFGSQGLHVAFNSSATSAIIQSLLRNVRFRTVGGYSTAPRQLDFLLTDATGQWTSASKTVNVTG
jgi:hypothetical protein